MSFLEICALAPMRGATPKSREWLRQRPAHKREKALISNGFWRNFVQETGRGSGETAAANRAPALARDRCRPQPPEKAQQ